MNSVYSIDIAHPPVHGEEAELLLSSALRKVQSSPTFRVLKIIHGHGSGGQGGTLKTVVQNWAFKNKSRIKLIIEGINLSPFNPDVQRLCSECNLQPSKDVGESNKGITLIWVK